VNEDFAILRQFVREYELDPKHTITNAHINHRRHCVVTYGADQTALEVRKAYESINADRVASICIASRPIVAVPVCHHDKKKVKLAYRPKHKRS
jgi:hypothetical protein